MHTLPEQILGHRFKNPELASQALTHRSHLNEHADKTLKQDYQRLEFLGDAVLGLLLATILLQRFPDMPEGDLSRRRASLVDQPSLARLATEHGLPSLILLGKGAEKEGGRRNPSILADVFEALVGAIYLDAGFVTVQQIVTALYQPQLDRPEPEGSEVYDAKSALQELLAVRKLPAPNYRIVDQHGPDHDRSFVVEVLSGNAVLGTGSGRSKKNAQQNAAVTALAQLMTKST